MWPATDTFGVPSPSARARARARLRRAIADDSRRQASRRRWRRWMTASLATVVLTGITPVGLDGEAAPLIGLADAVADGPRVTEPVGRHWYSISETKELVSRRVSLEEEIELQFLVSAVEEIWHDAGDVPRRSVTYGTPRFLSPEDEDAFHAAGLAKSYDGETQISVAMASEDYRFATALTGSSSEEIESTLRRRIAGLGDRRMEEVRLLQLTAELIQVHADDPLMRAQILRVIADIPGILVLSNARNVVVSIDYVDGDRPLRLMYEFDADTAHLVGEYLAALATQTEPATVLRSARHSLPAPLGVSGS